MKLYTYSRSTTAYRVRAALNLKGLAYDAEPVNLVSGEQRTADYRALNPAKGVPTLVLDDGTVLTQSIAIIEYLDTLAPTPPMLSQDPLTRARMQAVVMSIATDIHPVNNLRVVQHLKNGFGASADQCQGWMQHWMKEGFAATEALLPDSGWPFQQSPPHTQTNNQILRTHHELNTIMGQQCQLGRYTISTEQPPLRRVHHGQC